VLPVRETAQALLDAVVATYDDAGVDLPDRQRVTAGDARTIAWDCEQVTVALVQLLPAQSGQPAQTTYTGRATAGTRLMRSALWEVQVVRCHPEDPDQPAELEAAGREAMDDAALIAASIVRAIRDGIGGEHTTAAPAEVAPLGPAGGFVATYGRLTTSVLEPLPDQP
jgi:hypothetical protein